MLDILYFPGYYIKAVADVAELADAHGSGPCEGNFMQVQVREPFLRE